jgi:hypothetical protein
MRFVLSGALAVAGVAALVYAVPPMVLRDAEVPPRVAQLVDDARQWVIGNSSRFPLPLHPRLIDARCFDSGFVALGFEEWVPPYLGVQYAVTVGRHESGLEGGYHLDSIGPGSQIERDYISQLGDEVACD